MHFSWKIRNASLNVECFHPCTMNTNTKHGRYLQWLRTWLLRWLLMLAWARWLVSVDGAVGVGVRLPGLRVDEHTASRDRVQTGGHPHGHWMAALHGEGQVGQDTPRAQVLSCRQGTEQAQEDQLKFTSKQNSVNLSSFNIPSWYKLKSVVILKISLSGRRLCHFRCWHNCYILSWFTMITVCLSVFTS